MALLSSTGNFSARKEDLIPAKSSPRAQPSLVTADLPLEVYARRYELHLF